MTFLVLKPEYPHESASNSLFSVKKGEILECPMGYKPSGSFQICDTEEAAKEYIKLISLSGEEKDTVAKRVKKAEEKDGSSPTVAYPLFRKVSGLGGEESSYQLFSRDIHRFLSRDEKAIIADIEKVKMHFNTATRLLEYEKAHFTRSAVMAILEQSCKKNQEVKVPEEKVSKKKSEDNRDSVEKTKREPPKEREGS